MTILNDPVAMERRIRNLEMAVKRAKKLIKQVEDELKNHAERISANETDIQTGKEKLIEHENRIAVLEGEP